ncbi:MAG: OsmC family protein [Deltaproteobacteria bacterium]|nr:OsmC family protein [Deltaproteobacteria bacterium]
MKKELPYYYNVEVGWTGKRKSIVSGPNLPVLQVAAPPEFDGEEGSWTPEHLYVASVGVCFMTTFLAIAQVSRLAVVSLTVLAKGRLDRIAGVGFQVTEIVLTPRLVVSSSRDLERAAAILQKAEKNCLISNSVKTKVRLEPEIYSNQTPAYPCPPIAAAEAFKS